MIFLLCCLACWRICHFIAKEPGPWYFMWDFRYWFEDRESLSTLLSCVRCLSVWVSAVFAYICFDDHRMLYWLAMSSVVMILEEIYGMLRGQA